MKRLILLLPFLVGSADLVIDTGQPDLQITSLQKGLVLSMPLDSDYTYSSTVASDREPDGITAMTLQGTAAFTSSGVSLDGNSDYLEYTVSAWGSSYSAGTVNAWVYVDDLSSARAVFSSGDQAGTNNFIYTSIGTDGLPFVRIRVAGAQNNIDVTACSAGIVTTTNWHMVTISSDDSNYYVDLDGQPCTLNESIGGVDGDWIAQIPNRDNVTIGVVHISSLAQYFDGYISTVQIWDRALTTAEKASLYEQGAGGADLQITSLQKGLVGWWPLTDDYIQSSTVASDRTPNEQHLTAGGTPPAITSSGITFDSTSSDYIGLNVSDFRSSDNAGGISVWTKTASGEGSYLFTSCDASSNLHSLALFVSSGGVYFDLKIAGTQYQLSNTAVAIDDNAWHHVAVTSNGTRFLLYVDGQSVAITEKTVGDNNGKWFDDIANRDNIVVGALLRASAGYADGSVRELRLYDREPSATEITSLYEQGH